MRTKHIVMALGSCLLLAASTHAQDSAGPVLSLPVNGRVFEGDRKLEGCEVLTFKGNELVGTQVTNGNGRFGMILGLGEEYAIEFRKEGFLAKRILVDTRGELPKDLVEIAPLDMAMNMLTASKYQGADIDELDFPFAIVRYDRSSKAFIQDNQYTADMMRTNGALLLMSGRAGKE